MIFKVIKALSQAAKLFTVFIYEVYGTPLANRARRFTILLINGDVLLT
jgi:hypothetical protein